MGICMGTVWLRGVEFSVLGRGGVRGGVAKMLVYQLGIRRIVIKHDCTLPKLYPKHSSAWGV